MDRVTLTVHQKFMDSTSDLDLIQRFVEDCELRGFSPETIRSHRSNLRIIVRFLRREGWKLSDVDNNVLKQILDYLKNERKVIHKTREGYFTALSSFFDFLSFE